MPELVSFVDMLQKYNPEGFQKLMDSTGKFADFNIEGKVDLNDYATITKLKNGDYSMLKDIPGMEQGMENLGREFLDLMNNMNKKFGTKIDLSETKEFSGFGKLDAKKVGAVLLAASMQSKIGRDGKSLTSSFDNELSLADMQDMQNPINRIMTKAIAEQILGDMKLMDGKKLPYVNIDTTTAEADAGFSKTVTRVNEMLNEQKRQR